MAIVIPVGLLLKSNEKLCWGVWIVLWSTNVRIHCFLLNQSYTSIWAPLRGKTDEYSILHIADDFSCFILSVYPCNEFIHFARLQKTGGLNWADCSSIRGYQFATVASIFNLELHFNFYYCISSTGQMPVFLKTICLIKIIFKRDLRTKKTINLL